MVILLRYYYQAWRGRRPGNLFWAPTHTWLVELSLSLSGDATAVAAETHTNQVMKCALGGGGGFVFVLRTNEQ